MKDKIALIEPFLSGNALALVSGGKLQDFFADFETSKPFLVGATFVGEIDRLSKNSNSYFVSLPEKQSGFLKGVKNLKAGDKVLLQSRLFSSKKNMLQVTANLSFRGPYVVITVGTRKINFSRNIQNKLRRQSLKDLAEKYSEIKNRNYGIIFRSICKISCDNEIRADIEKQLSRCVKVSSTEPKDILIVEDAPNALEKAKQEWPIFEEQEAMRGIQCFDSFSIWEQILMLQDFYVNLPSGGNFSIEPTEALVAIDVNTGRDTSISAGLKSNLEAIAEIPRQLRIRGLGGKIVIELGPLLRKQREKIESILRKSLNSYSDKIRIAGWTPLGNLELEKSRDRMPLGLEQFSQIEKNMKA